MFKGSLLSFKTIFIIKIKKYTRGTPDQDSVIKRIWLIHFMYFFFPIDEYLCILLLERSFLVKNNFRIIVKFLMAKINLILLLSI